MERGIAESPIGEGFALPLRCESLRVFLGPFVEEVDDGAL
jgi:hypothetical protein